MQYQTFLVDRISYHLAMFIVVSGGSHIHSLSYLKLPGYFHEQELLINA